MTLFIFDFIFNLLKCFIFLFKIFLFNFLIFYDVKKFTWLSLTTKWRSWLIHLKCFHEIRWGPRKERWLWLKLLICSLCWTDCHQFFLIFTLIFFNLRQLIFHVDFTFLSRILHRWLSLGHILQRLRRWLQIASLLPRLCQSYRLFT